MPTSRGAFGQPQAIRALLSNLRAHLGMEVAFISEFRDGQRVFRYVDSDWPENPVIEGCGDPLEESYCQRVVDGRLPQVIQDAQELPEAAAIPATRTLPVGAHISVPIRTGDGRVYGTFCAFSRHADPDLRDHDAATLHVLADMIAGPLAQEALERAEVDTAARAIDAVIRDGGPDIVYQPIVDLDLGEPVGYEALSRFRNGEAPDRWFSRAAAAGRTVDLEIAAIRAALRGLPCLPEAVYVAVNASETTLLSPALTAALAGVPPERLVLELTEHVAVEDTTALVAHLAPLRASGVRLAVDDTGSGYAGLQQLLGLRPDILKIDGELTREVASDPARQALAWALAWFARKTGACLIAEGIETSEDMETLRSVGVQHGQGYHLGRPAPLAQILYSRITA